MIKVWDLWVRLFHWSLVFAVCFLLISGNTGIGFFNWHRLAGEFVLLLIMFRLAWGFVGSSNARLARLIVSPLRVLEHFIDLSKRSVKQERGHNAAGGWAVLVMLALISVQVVTGMFIADDEEWVEGAFHGMLSSNNTDFLLNVHHINASLLQWILVIHVGMIAVYFFVGKQNLVGPMITGSMKWIESEQAPAVRFARFVSGLLVAVGAFLVVALCVGWFG